MLTPGLLVTPSAGDALTPTTAAHAPIEPIKQDSEPIFTAFPFRGSFARLSVERVQRYPGARGRPRRDGRLFDAVEKGNQSDWHDHRAGSGRSRIRTWDLF